MMAISTIVFYIYKKTSMHVSKHLHDFQVKNVHYENEPFMVDDTVYHVKTEIKIDFL